jgi:dipeptidyl aminopeptidase/acylaminoacyl peptidase
VVSPGRAGTSAEMGWLAHPLADAGYTVLAQGYRTGGTRYQLRDVADVRHSVSWLHDEMSAENCRVAAIGHSRGASASLRAAADDSRIDSTVSLCAPIDVARYMRGLSTHSPSRYQLLVKAYGASPDADPEYYSQIAPLTHALRHTKPVLLIHGADDMVAPKEHSEWMYEALVRHGTTLARLRVIEGAGHFFENRFNGYLYPEVIGLILDWLEERCASG